MDKKELAIRVDTLTKYFNVMNLSIPSQNSLNRFLRKRDSSIDWSDYQKNEIAVKYALGQFLNENDWYALYNYFGDKKHAIDFDELIKERT